MNARERAEAAIEERSRVMAAAMKTFPKTAKAADPPKGAGGESLGSGDVGEEL